MGPTGNLQGSYKFLSLSTGKKVTRRKFTEMPITDSVIKKVEEMAVKDGAVNGILFKNRKGVEYMFDNEDEYETLMEPDEPSPYPDIPAEAPGILTAIEEEYRIDNVVQDEPGLSKQQRALLAAQNSGLDFSSIPTKVNGGEVIEILDDNEEEALNEYIKEELQVMVEPIHVEEQEEACGMEELDKDGGPRRSGRRRIPNRQFKDYDLYITVEEEEVMLANIEECALDEEEDEEVLAAVAHYIMVHYEEKESLKMKKKEIQAKSWAIRAGGRNQTFW
jgi:hypothetical protein